MAEREKRNKTRGKGTDHDLAADAMILMEYARNPKPREIARKFGLKHHSYVTRLWEKLPEERKQEYLTKAQDIHEEVAERIATRDFEFVERTANRLSKLMDDALDEWEERLRNPVKRAEVPAKELTNFIRLAQNFVVDNTAKPGEGDAEKTSANALFNLFDNSISEQLNSEKDE